MNINFYLVIEMSPNIKNPSYREIYQYKAGQIETELEIAEKQRERMRTSYHS